MIELKGIRKSFDSQEVLKGIELLVEKGDSLALIGPSGSGKSTLLRIMIGLIKQTEGTVKLFGEETSKENILSLRHRIGYVIQEGGLFPHLSAYDNIAILARHLEWREDHIYDIIRELCELTKIEFVITKRRPAKLSGGQRQRVSLMRALMLDPELILLDEPLASIDPLVRYELQNELKEIFERLKKTVVLVSHDLGEAAFLSNRIVLMKDGLIEQEGSIKNLLEHPKNEFVEEFINAQRSPISNL